MKKLTIQNAWRNYKQPVTSFSMFLPKQIREIQPLQQKVKKQTPQYKQRFLQMLRLTPQLILRPNALNNSCS
ncbi:MAG: hypothetical protein J5601_07080 [Elusimicrobiaceae bacterium]|nr:hypothetical protein [Elusimicrobiaceae bacterium]